MRHFCNCGLVFLLVATAGVACAVESQSVLVEAEAFADYGGWVPDQQFMDEMGSPYLLAHGLGNPVADAATMVVFPSTGTYRVWVRTFDWVARWNAPGGPGRFQVLVDGKALGETFGAEGKKWHWQQGPAVEVDKLEVSVALCDLTGFEGRCDAILFTKDAAFTPPNIDPAMSKWRARLLGLSAGPKDCGQYDLVVVGGGMAGVCASLQAARLGLKVALIQDRPVLGGNNSSEVRVWLNGDTNFEPYPRIGDVVRELEPAKRAHYGPANTGELYEDGKRTAVVRAQENISLFLRHRANKVETAEGKITAVIAENITTGQQLRFAGKYFADCTGDGCVGYLAGADYEMTLDGHMGRCNLWNVLDTGEPVSFARCPWALDLGSKPFPTGEKQLGAWFWESGFYHDPFEKSEYIRDWNFRAMYGAWDALKNVKGIFPNHKLNWAAYISGKRESRRLLGDLILTKEDFVQGFKYPDGCVPCSWQIDLHLPDPQYDDGWEGDEFISKAYYTSYDVPYWVPYRCLYSRNVANLFMAGRDISVTHEALGAVRVMRTGGMMGQIVGMAASICKKYDTMPRGVYMEHLTELIDLMKKEVTVAWLEGAGANLARHARVSVSSDYDSAKYPKSHINDGQWDVTKSDLRWLSSDAAIEDYVVFEWDRPQTISAARIVSGWFDGRRAGNPIADFALQYYDGGAWRDIAGAAVTNNRQVKWLGKFDAVKSDRIRLVITKTPGDISRLWEVEFFHPKADANDDGLVNFSDVAESVRPLLARRMQVE